jgi:hypothetical protein
MFSDRFIFFDTSSQQYNSFQKLNLPDFCSALSVKNTGNTVCLFDDEPLFPGESKIYSGDEGEVLVGRHSIGFTTVAVGFTPPGVPVNQAWVSYKYYVQTPMGSKTTIQ